MNDAEAEAITVPDGTNTSPNENDALPLDVAVPLPVKEGFMFPVEDEKSATPDATRLPETPTTKAIVNSALPLEVAVPLASKESLTAEVCGQNAAPSTTSTVVDPSYAARVFREARESHRG